MPSLEKFEKSKLTGVVDDFLRSKHKDLNEEVEFLSILDYIDRFKLLPSGLYPVQKFILKLYYNIPLDNVLPDNTSDRIKITKGFRSNKFIYMTEVEYLAYLFEQGHCNIKVQDFKARHELILVLGRRGGKSILASLIASYELYKLLRRYSPQIFYGMPVTSEIRILCIANDKDQAEIVYQDINGYVNSVDYFSTALANNTTQFMKFRTPYDKEKFGEDGRSTITATFKSSIAKGLRGRGVMCFILDEFAFFINDSGKSNAREIYRAISPSLKQFTPKDLKDKRIAVGPSDGRTIVISSPDSRDGFFYSLYQMSTSGDIAASNTLMIQAPTWEVNPTLSQQDYEVEYAKDPKAFDTEYGANFSDRVRGWIEDSKDLTDCIIPDLRPIHRGNTREPFWIGIDFALVKDGTAIVLTHLKNGKINLAYHEVWYAGKRWADVNPHLSAPLTNYANLLQDVKRLDIDEIVRWIVAISKKFYLMKGVFDQWAGTIFEQKLHKEGLTQLESNNFSVVDSSKMYQNMKMLLYASQLGLYDYPLPQTSDAALDFGSNQHSPLIKEILELQSYSGGKNIIVVEAPNVAGKHDDISDALVRSIFLASEYIRENPGVLENSYRSLMIQGPGVNDYGFNQYHRLRARLHGPKPIERRVPFSHKRY